MNHQYEHNKQFPPQTINSDSIIDFLDQKTQNIIGFSLNVYDLQIFTKNNKEYLILKRIISHLQKTIKNITDEDLINVQIQKRNYTNPILKNISILKKTKTKGRIYILKTIGHPYYKIGKTTNLNNRINQISPALPFKTKLIHTIQSNNINKTEKFLHEKFKDKRTNEEWFDLSKKDIQLLCRTNTINK